MEKKSSLEEELMALTTDFVTRVVARLRHASFEEVGSYSDGLPSPSRPPPPQVRLKATGEGKRPRQTASKRVELGDRILEALSKAEGPAGVRAIADILGVAPGLLVVPLRELRASAKIVKHGDKRKTTYGLA
ncbi:MAG: hypothetical protein WCI05_12315 [Myxococcales bacterium]